MRKAIVIITTLLVCAISYAQKDSAEFRVKSFRKLEWDLDAQVTHPKMDQNNKKAALIKVVTAEPDFDFDVGIMGVVEVKHETGEFWVYVPEHIKGITIRHPKFGIIRNYTFDIPIESASVYELTLVTPKKEPERTVIVRDSIVYVTLPQGNAKVKRQRKPFEISFIPLFGIPVSSETLGYYGIITAYEKGKYGINTEVDFFFGADRKRIGITVGGNIKCGKRTKLTSGIGYCYEYEGYCYEYEGYFPDLQPLATGFGINLGAIMAFGPVAVYAGAKNIAFKYFYAEVGIGVRLKMKTETKK